MRAVIATVLTLLLVACGGGSESKPAATTDEKPSQQTPPTVVTTTATAARAPGCGKTPPAAGLRAITSDNVARTYRLFVPSTYRNDRPIALVLNYHGFAGESQGQEWYAGFNDIAQRTGGFIVVTPDGSGDPQRWWLAPAQMQGYVDDFAFTRRMLDDVVSLYCVDPERIYASGISNGGFFSSIAACELNDRIAAIATVAGEGFPDEQCRGKKPVPVIVFHGTEDATVPFEPPPGRTRLGIAIRSTRDSVAGWAKHNGCNGTPAEQRTAPDIVFVSYEGCKDRADVQLYIVEGGGHSWPGATPVDILGHTTQSIKASELMWQFFAAHPRGER